MVCSGRRLLRNSDGAVAPTIALSLVALIAAGGLAFDYARMATMHTELQDAADQAALAAATQLDGQPGACARAAAAAADLLTNKTYFASYGWVRMSSFRMRVPAARTHTSNSTRRTIRSPIHRALLPTPTR